MHTAYLGKVISFNGTTATIQPLQRDTSIIPNVPVVQNARYKLTEEKVNRLVNGNNGCTASLTSGAVNCSCYSQSFTNLVKKPLQAEDIVIVVCCERNISTALKGKLPSSSEPTESYSLSNSIIVGIL